MIFGAFPGLGVSLRDRKGLQGNLKEREGREDCVGIVERIVYGYDIAYTAAPPNESVNVLGSRSFCTFLPMPSQRSRAASGDSGGASSVASTYV